MLNEPSNVNLDRLVRASIRGDAGTDSCGSVLLYSHLGTPPSHELAVAINLQGLRRVKQLVVALIVKMNVAGLVDRVRRL